jgi:hypothetical protein
MGQKILQVAFLFTVTVLAFAEPKFQNHRRVERYQQQPFLGGGLRNFLFGPFPIRQTTHHYNNNNDDNKPTYFPRKPKQQQVIKRFRVQAFVEPKINILFVIKCEKRFFDAWCENT